MSDYYHDLASHPDPARVVGWENRLAQMARFEAVRAVTTPGATLLDLGAGLGDLGRHLRAVDCTINYIGIEKRPDFVARASLMSPSIALTAGDAFPSDAATLPQADVVAAVGALVDGASLRHAVERFGRLRRMFAVIAARADRVAVAVIARQEQLEADPLRAADPALGGVTRAEIPWLVPPGFAFSVIDDLLPGDVVVYLARDAAWLPRDGCGAQLRASALAHPLAQTVAITEQVRFHLLTGDLETARNIMENVESDKAFRPDAAWRLLRQRLDLAASGG